MNETPARKTLPRLDESLLTNVPPFSRLDRRQIRALLDQASSRRYDEGVTVFAEGEPAERFYLLLDGTIRVVRLSGAGEQVTVLHIPAGQLFGIAKALGRDSYPATAITASESIALSWPARLWDTLVSDYEGFASETYKIVGDRVDEMKDRIVETATRRVEQRVATALLRLVNQTGRTVDEGIEIDFPITRQDLSELTGTTLHTVSRLLSGWEREGLVRSGRRRITVRDPHRLLVLSES